MITKRDFILRGSCFCEIYKCKISCPRTVKHPVYLIMCLLCQEQYVGESSRTLHVRLSEHLRFATSPDNKNYKDEALAVHYRQYHQGQIPQLSFKLLNSEPNTVSRKIIEAMHIQQLKPQLNDKDECVSVNRFLVKNWFQDHWTEKKDRKQSIKNKNNRSLSFHFDFLGLSVCGFVSLWLCPFVRLSVFFGFSDVPLYLTNYSIKLIYMHIMRTSSMRGLKWCALFVVSAHISRVINENVRKMVKTKI